MVTQNPSKFKHMVVTGVLASKCAQHDFFLHNAVVDMQKGERYVTSHPQLVLSLTLVHADSLMQTMHWPSPSSHI